MLEFGTSNLKRRGLSCATENKLIWYSETHRASAGTGVCPRRPTRGDHSRMDRLWSTIRSTTFRADPESCQTFNSRR